MNRIERVAFFVRLTEENGEIGPLYFSEARQKGFIEETKEKSLDVQILAALDYAYSNRTYVIYDEKRKEQYSGGRRSSFDIWRILRGIGYEGTLPRVMQELYNIRGSVNINLCSGAGRRMFRPMTIPPNVFHASNGMYDEYGLTFEEWNDIEGAAGLNPVIAVMYDPNEVLFRSKFVNEFRQSVIYPVRF